MKLFSFVLVVSVLAAASGEDSAHGHMSKVHLCGRDLAQAVERVCNHGDINYLNSKHTQHRHQHDYQEVHNVKGHAMKRDTTESLVEMCCVKPCLVKDFVDHCPS